MPRAPFHAGLCVSSLIWRGRPIADAARAMMRLGLRQLELAARPLAPDHYDPDGDNGRLFNILAEAGVSVTVLRLTGLTREQKIRAIAEAGRRGIPAVLDRVERLNFPDLLDRLRVYALCARREGVHFILENDRFTSCDNANAQITLSRLIDQPSLGFGFAPPHAVADNLDPAEEVLALGDSLRLAYLWDATAKLRVRRGAACPSLDAGPPEEQTPGNSQGRVQWEDYFAALARIGFRGIFNLSWLGSESWSDFQIGEALASSVQFCSAQARTAGLG